MTDVSIARKEARSRGLIHYFTGAPCKNGHIAPRLVSTKNCTACRPAYRSVRKDWMLPSVKKYRDANKARLNAKRRVTRSINPTFKEMQREYYTANRSAINANRAKYRRTHREHINAVRLSWMENNPADAIRYRKNDYRKHKDAYITRARNRRYNLAKCEGSHDSQELGALLKKQNNRCALCFVSLSRARFHADHIVPVSKRGSNTIGNIQITCAKCNLRKGSKDPFEFARSLGRLL